MDLPEIEQGLTEHDIPDVIVHAISENFLTVEIGSQKLDLSKLSAMILVKQLSHALNRNTAPKRSWLWKLRMKRLLAQRDKIVERMAILMQTIRHNDLLEKWSCEKLDGCDIRKCIAELTKLDCRKTVAIREIRNMEME